MRNNQVTSFVRRNRTFFVGLFVIIPALVLPFLLVYSLFKAEFMQGWCYLHGLSEQLWSHQKPGHNVGMHIGHVERYPLSKRG